MSSKKGQTMPIRVDDDIREWLAALRDALGEDTISATLRRVILKAHPNVERLTELSGMKEEERIEAMRKLLEDDSE